MSGFLYYVPCDVPPSRESMRELGFPHAHIASLPGCHCNCGPDDQQGYTFSLSQPKAAGGVLPKVGYKPDDQEWLECDNGKFYLGIDIHSRPNPLDLQNEQSITGEFVKLADGNEWKVPVIRQLDGSPAIESVLSIKADGGIVFDKPAPQYMRVWGLVQRLWEQSTDPKMVLSEAEIFDLICDVMALNYRISRWEIGNLSLFTDKTLSEVMKVIVGIGVGNANGF